MKTYTFNVVVEPDEDRWHAYCPALHQQGAATWGSTREEALKNIEDVVRLVMESMVEHDEPLPAPVRGEVEVTVEPRVAITVLLMASDYGPLRGTTARELISALIRDGFAFDRGSGSHQIYRHSDGRRGLVTFHRSVLTRSRRKR